MVTLYNPDTGGIRLLECLVPILAINIILTLRKCWWNTRPQFIGKRLVKYVFRTWNQYKEMVSRIIFFHA